MRACPSVRNTHPARADLHDDGIGMFGDKVPGHIVQQLRPPATATAML